MHTKKSIRGVILFLLFVTLLFYCKKLHSTDKRSTLVGKPAVLVFENKEVSGRITEEVLENSDKNLISNIVFVADVLQEFSDDDLLNYRRINIDGWDLITSIVSPGQMGVLVLKEHFRLMKVGWNDLTSFTLIDNAQPLQSRSEDFHGNFFYEGRNYEVRFRVRIEQYNPFGTMGFIIIDHVNVQPSEIDSRFGNTGGVEAEIAVSFNGMEGFSQKVWWNSPGGGIQFKPLTDPFFRLVKKIDPGSYDFIFESDLSVKMYLTDLERGIFSFLRKPQQIGTLTLTGGSPPIPPSPPSVNVISQQSSLKIFVSHEDEDIDGFVLYKSLDPDFGVEDAEMLEVEGNIYLDEEVAGGTTYYFKATAIKGGLESNLSSIGFGMPQTKYKLNLGTELLQLSENEDFEIHGYLTDLNGIPVANERITVSIPEKDYTFEYLETDNEGLFIFQGFASTIAGSYQYTFSAGDNLSGINKNIIIKVLAKDERERNLAITNLFLNNLLQFTNQDIHTSIEVTNDGQVTEAGAFLIYRLKDQEGTVVLEDEKPLAVLHPESLTTVNHSLFLPDSLQEGSYNLEVTVFTHDSMDEFMRDNRTVRSFYIIEPFLSSVYRTKDYFFTEMTPCLTIDGYLLCIEDVNTENVSLTVQLNDELSGYIEFSNEGEIAWINNTNDFMVLPLELISYTDTTYHLKVKAGKANDGYQISPAYNVTKPGYWGDYFIQAPNGRELDLHSIDFPFGVNAGYMSEWARIIEPTENVNSLNLKLKMPGDAKIDSLYDTFLSFNDQEYSLYVRLKTKVAPYRKLNLENIDIENGYLEFQSGDLIWIEGNIQNFGHFKETPFVELSIYRNDTIVFSDFKEIDIAPEVSKSFAFDWSTISQDLGEYQIKLHALNYEDEQPNENIIDQTIIVEDTPLLEISIPALEVYNIGEDATIPIQVIKEDGAVVDNAHVFLSLEKPDSTTITRALEYNPATGFYYSPPVRLNSGGNYYFTIDAKHPRYISNSKDGVLQTYVDVSVEVPYANTSILHPLPIIFKIGNVGNLAAFAGDIIYDNEVFALANFNASEVFSGFGQVPVSSVYTENNQGLVFGMTRLSATHWGINLTKSKNFLSVNLIPKDEGIFNLQADNLTVINSYGDSLAVRVLQSSTQIDIEKPFVSMRISTEKVGGYLNIIDTASVFIGNGFSMSGVAGEISYDPNIIQIMDVWEENSFNESGGTNTIFQKSIDEENGIITFGLTRSVLNDKGINPWVSRVLSFSYLPLITDTTTIFGLEDTGIISVINGYEIPHQTYSKTIDIVIPDEGIMNVSIQPNEYTLGIDSVFYIDFYVENVHNIHSFVGDIHLNSNYFEVIEVIEGDFVNLNGLNETAFYYNIHQNGHVHLGISRLGQSYGSSTIYPSKVFSMKVRSDSLVQSEDIQVVGDFLRTNGEIQSVDYLDTLLFDTSIPLFSEIYIDPNTHYLSPDSIFEFRLFVQHVQNVSSFVANINYNPEQLQLIEVSEGAFLSEDGLVPTSFLIEHDNETGNIHAAATRLGYEYGASTDLPKKILNFKFAAIDIGGTQNSELDFSVDFIDENYHLVSKYVSDTLFFETLNQIDSRIFIVPENSEPEIDSIIDLSVFIENVDDVASFSSDVYYNPQVLELTNVSEGIFLNENESTSTSFLYYEDIQSGLVHLGISRLGNIEGVSTLDSVLLFDLQFRVLSEDSVSVNISNSVLFKSDGITQLPHVVSNAFINYPEICDPPYMLEVSNITSSSAEISWQTVNEETIWNIAYGISGFEMWEDGETVSNIFYNPYLLDNLQASQIYDVYLQAVCNETKSEWSVPISFITNHVITSSSSEGGTIFPEGIIDVPDMGSLLVSIDPDIGYFISDVLVDDENIGVLNDYLFEQVNQSHNIHADFQIYTYEVTANPNNEAYGYTEGSGIYEHGQQVFLEAIPNDGYFFENWTENSEIISSENNLIFYVEDDRMLTANFAHKVYTIQVIIDPENGGLVQGSGTYIFNEEVTLTATPAAGYHFVNWTENGEEVSADANYTFTAEADRTLTANFAISVYSITAQPNNEDFGTVSGTGECEHFEEVTLMATPATGYHFVNWTENGEEVSTDATYTFSAEEDRTLTANFAINVYSITAQPNNADFGNISGAGEYGHFEEVTLTATPVTGYHFIYWTEDGAEISDDATFVFMANASRQFMAHFAPQTLVSELEEQEIIYYPNPFNQKLTIQNATQVKKVIITNLLGQQMLEREMNGGETETVFTGNLPKGIYIVQFILRQDIRKTIKIIKE